MSSPSATAPNDGSTWNVNNWHWEEKNWTEWTYTRLREVLSNVTVDIPSGSLKSIEVNGLHGEAYVNIRKGKKRVGYELDFSVKWEGELQDGSGAEVAKSKGSIKFPYVCEDSEDEPMQNEVSVEGKTPADDRLKEAVRKLLVPLLVDKIKAVIDDLKTK
eukprot:TRINITY_DN677_c0_g1_i1.p1 TRINITY_DN677_c0_g1~~TRINITY_DN677_c0_g1_i1.p1  ORF type:complete len:184 (-),score=51.30 TRINITY_DN677_c0_g1_i1:74-553(-)